jgi:hypothetical protein
MEILNFIVNCIQYIFSIFRVILHSELCQCFLHAHICTDFHISLASYISASGFYLIIPLNYMKTTFIIK